MDEYMWRQDRAIVVDCHIITNPGLKPDYMYHEFFSVYTHLMPLNENYTYLAGW
jgi:hypothetical protein